MRKINKQPIYEITILGIDYYFFVESLEEAKQIGSQIKGLTCRLCFPRGSYTHAETQTVEEIREQMLVAIARIIDRPIFLQD